MAKNKKYIAYAAAAGFFLSCIVGFAGGTGLSVIFLRALIFAVVFGVLALAISLVSDKYLNFGSASDDSSLLMQGGEKSVGNSSQPGSSVNITIEDEPLPETELESRFDVTPAVKNFLSGVNSNVAQDSSKSAPVATPANPPAEPVSDSKPENFAVPDQVADLVDILDNTKNQNSNVEQPVSESAKLNVPVQQPTVQETTTSSVGVAEPKNMNSADSGIDELPDLTELIDVEDQNAASPNSDTEFASSVSSSLSSKKSSASADMQNSELLAKAIRTAISKDY